MYLSQNTTLMVSSSGSGSLVRRAKYIGNAISADTFGNIYIAGVTGANLGGQYFGYGDAFVTKYNENGVRQWTRQLGTPAWDTNYGVAADGLGHVYVSGYTWGSLDGINAGEGDAFISKYDESGAFLWTKQLGSALGT